MKCLILAAGYATRLYPLTENFPKPLLTVGDRSILDWLVEDIETSGLVDEYIVISNHKFAAHFQEWAAKTSLPIRVLDDGTSTNETRLGAVRDLQFAIDTLQLADDLLVIAGDNLLDFSMTEFIRYAVEKQTSCTMRYYEEDPQALRKAGVSEIGPEDRLVGMEEKPAEPKTHWCTPPFYFYRKEDAARIAEAIEDGCGVDAPGSLVAWMCRHTVMHSMIMPGRRYDIGDLASYEKVQQEFATQKQPRLIVSMTSYPKRIGGVADVLQSLLAQTHPADKVLLWLADSQFPGQDNDLPQAIRDLETDGRIEVRWCPDLKPHKKYLYAMREFPEDVIVTVDDDVLYPEDTLDLLYRSYRVFPKAVSAMRTHLMTFDEHGDLLPYRHWVKQTDICLNQPSMQLLATGVGGVLYPPHLLDPELLREDLVTDLCLYADDLWLKAVETIADIPTVQAAPYRELDYVPGSQDESLYAGNVRGGGNDAQFTSISTWFDAHYGARSLERHLKEPARGEDLTKVLTAYEAIDLERTRRKRALGASDARLQKARCENRNLKAKLAELTQEETNADPKVSVIIPVYNAEPYLRECLDSVIGQTLQNIEIFCVDDGSKDTSYQTLTEYAAKDARIRIFRQGNRGAGAARNLALQYARGEYLAFLDADDYFDRSLLALTTQIMDREASDVIITAANKLNQQTGKITPYKALFWDNIPDHTPFAAREMADHVLTDFQNWPWNKVYRRSYIEKLGLTFQEIPRSNDVAFVMNALAMAERISILNQQLIYRRENTGTSLQQTNAQTPLSFWNAYLEAKRRLQQYGVFETFERSFLNKLLEIIFYNLRVIKTKEGYEKIVSHVKYHAEQDFGFLSHPDSYYFEKKLPEYKALLRTYREGLPVIEKPAQTLLSVIIPVYNADGFLRQTLSSILEQSLQEIEVICVDDGSTDCSREIIREYMQADQRVQLLCQENQYAGAARNAGLQAASGEYVHFLDADDYVLDGGYETLYRIAHENQLDYLKCSADSFDETLQQIVPNPFYSQSRIPEDCFDRILGEELKDLIQHMCVTPWSGIYRREFLLENEIRFNHLVCVNDRSFFMHMITKAKRVMLNQTRLVVHRSNLPGSLVSRRAAHYDCQFESIRIIEAQLAKDEVPEALASAIMDYEYIDLVTWCKKLYKDRTYGKQILQETGAFLEGHEEPYTEEARRRYARLLVKKPSKKKAPEPKKQVDPAVKKLKKQLAKEKALRVQMEAELAEMQQKQAQAEADLAKAKKQKAKAEAELKKVRSSWAFRAGRFLTWLPRTIRRLFAAKRV